jgi:hypothetical protein
MISASDINVLRLIMRAGENYAEIKRLLGNAVWKVEENEPELGYLRVGIPAGKTGDFFTLIIGYRDSERPPYLILTFVCFPDSPNKLAEFDAAFRAAADAIQRVLGKPALSGERQLSSRNWLFAYQRWSLPEGEFTLLQDEFDIQNGMDVTLWVQPAGTPLDETLRI